MKVGAKVMLIFESRKEERKNFYKSGTDYADYVDFLFPLRNRKIKPHNPCLKISVNHFEAQIRNECLGHADAFGGLIVFQQRSYDAGKSES